MNGRNASAGIALLPDIMAASVAVAAAGLLFSGTFGTAAALSPIWVAALVPTVVLAMVRVVTDRLRWLVLAHLGTLIVGVLLAAALVGRFRPPSIGVALAVGRTMADSGWRLLAMTLPAPARPELLVLPAALVWVANTVAVTLAMRRPGRLEAVLPAVAVMVIALVLDGQKSPWSRWAILVIGICIVFLLVSGMRPIRPLRAPVPSRSRTKLTSIVRSAATLVGLAVAFAALLLPPLSSLPRHPVDPRALIARPIDVGTDVNPIDLIAGWRSNPDRVLFRASGAPKEAWWQLTVLDEYDGRTWSSSSGFRPAGLGVPSAPRVATSARQRIDIVTLDGPYLPALDRPVALDGTATAVDVDTGVLLGAPHAGLQYTVDSAITSPPDRSALARLAPATDVAVVSPPRQLISLLQSQIEPAVDPYTTADRLRMKLQHEHPNVGGAFPGGTSIRSIQVFLASGAPGTAIEFAETVALALRTRGVPTRLVAGFIPDPRRPTELRGADATIWVQLKLASVGWVSVQTAPPPTRATTLTAPPAPAPPAAAAAPEPPPTIVAVPPTDRSNSTDPRITTVLLAAAAGLCGLGTLYIVAVLSLPCVRRWRRRHASTTSRRIAHAWHDVLESMPAAMQPARQTPSDLTVCIGTDEASALALLVERALFSPERLPAKHAADAWSHADQLRRRLHAQPPGRLRLVARLSTRNLRIDPRYRPPAGGDPTLHKRTRR